MEFWDSIAIFPPLYGNIKIISKIQKFKIGLYCCRYCILKDFL
jgi:hypothetical protein